MANVFLGKMANVKINQINNKANYVDQSIQQVNLNVK